MTGSPSSLLLLLTCDCFPLSLSHTVSTSLTHTYGTHAYFNFSPFHFLYFFPPHFDTLLICHFSIFLYFRGSLWKKQWVKQVYCTMSIWTCAASFLETRAVPDCRNGLLSMWSVTWQERLTCDTTGHLDCVTQLIWLRRSGLILWWWICTAQFLVNMSTMAHVVSRWKGWRWMWCFSKVNNDDFGFGSIQLQSEDHNIVQDHWPQAHVMPRSWAYMQCALKTNVWFSVEHVWLVQLFNSASTQFHMLLIPMQLTKIILNVAKI